MTRCELLELGEDALLEGHALRDCLDDEVCSSHGFGHIAGRVEVARPSGLLLWRGLAALDASVPERVNCRHSFCQSVRKGIVESGLPTTLGADLCYPCAHRAGADDGDGLDFHPITPGRRPLEPLGTAAGAAHHALGSR